MAAQYTPWVVVGSGPFRIEGKKGNGKKHIASCFVEGNAQDIVRAVNAHEALVAALKEAQRLLRQRTDRSISECRALDKMDAALALAKGEG